METCTQGQQAGSEISARARRNLSKLSILFLIMSSQVLGMGQNPGAKDKSGSESRPSEIPFKLYNDNLIVVKGNVGPIGGVNFILDTGTTPTSISKSLASRLKLSGTSEPLQTLSGAIETQSFVVPHIQIGAFCADQVRVVTQDFKFVEESLGLSIGGILGLDVLRSHSFTIDYRKKKITFQASDTANSTPFESQSPLLTVKVKIGDQNLRFIVDSGTQGLIAFRNHIKQPAEMLRSVQGTFISTVAGTPPARFFRTLVELGEDRREQTVTIAEVDPLPETDFDGLLGFTAMGFRRVSFDFEHGTLGWESDFKTQSSVDEEPESRLPSIECAAGLQGNDCQFAVDAVARILQQLTIHVTGWRVVIVPDEHWNAVATVFRARESAPAFSNLIAMSTYLDEVLVFPKAGRDTELRALTSRTGIERLTWALSHEYGHIACNAADESKAERAGGYLRRGQPGVCS